MFFYYTLTDQLSAFDSSFVNDDFVMFSQLDFVIFYCIIHRIVFLIAVFYVMDDLQQVDWNSKDLSTRLQNLLILFNDGFILFF